MSSSIYEQNKPMIHLQGIGKVHAKMAGDIVRGDVIMWNFGETTKILAVQDVSKCYIEIHYNHNGVSSERRLKKDRLVGLKLY